MPTQRTSTLWRGRALALVGIVLVAANLRTAVTALSAIYPDVRHDVPLSSVTIGVLGMLPPVCFAVFGIFAPVFTRRLRLESVLLIAIGCIVAGTALRAASGSYVTLLAGSALAFAGMGTGNVLLPPLVKRYFPDAIGTVTSLYATIMSVTALLPPLIAVPVADSLGWRVSSGMWAILALGAMVPWIGVLGRHAVAVRTGAIPVVAGTGAGGRVVRSGSASTESSDTDRGAAPDTVPDAVPDVDAADHVEEADAAVVSRLWRIPLAWALGVTFAVSSIISYAMFAWLPQIVHDVAGVSPEAAGALLSLDAAMGLPAAILVPWLASRMNVAWLIYLGLLFFLVGFGGLIFLPTMLIWLWVALIGLGPLVFPLCLVLINMRTRTHAGSVALSGFVQGLGYSLGALGPISVGLLHQLTGTWTLALIVLAATSFAYLFTGAIVARPKFLEDMIAARERGHGRGAVTVGD